MTTRSVALLVAVALLPAIASAGDPRTAEILFQRAQTIMKKADAPLDEIHQACTYFVESYKQDPAVNTLVAAAACHEREGKNATAWGEYKQVGAQQGSASDYANQRAAELEKKGFLKITVKVAAGAPRMTFKIDDEQPLSIVPEDFPMDPGPHDLEVKAPGKTTFKKHFELSDRVSPLTLSIPLLEDEKGAPPPPPPQVIERIVRVEAAKSEPVYKGFYGRVAFPFHVGLGTAYSLPAGVPGSVAQGFTFAANVKLNIGYSFDWYALEFVTIGQFYGRIDDKILAADGTKLIRVGYPAFATFLGVGGRATSKHEVFRVTGSLALGGGPRMLAGVDVGPICDGGNSTPLCMGMGGSQKGGSAGYGFFALAGDVGIMLGSAPGAKFFVGIDWMLEVPGGATVVVDPRIPPAYLADPAQHTMRLLTTPQFLFGPTLGVGFGH